MGEMEKPNGWSMYLPVELQKMMKDGDFTRDDYIRMTDLRRLREELYTGYETRLHLPALRTLRGMLTSSSQPPIEDVVHSGVVPRCVQFLRMDESVELQYEAAHILLYFAAGHEQCINVLINAGAVEALIDLLPTPNQSVAELALRALGNIVAEGPVFRNTLISKGIIPPLVDLVTGKTPSPLLVSLTWIIAELCRPEKPSSPLESIALCVPAVIKIIKMSELNIVARACRALSYLCGRSTDTFEVAAEEIRRSGLVKRLVELLDCGHVNVIISCFPAVINYVGSFDLRALQFINAGLLPCLAKLLKSENDEIVRYAAGTVRNIVTKSISQVYKVVAAGFVPLLVDVLNTKKLGAREHAVYALMCITIKYDRYVVPFCIVEAIPAMCDMLKCQDWKLVLTVLTAIRATLTSATELDQIEYVASVIEESGGLSLIKELKFHESPDICQLAVNIIDKFFPAGQLGLKLKALDFI